MRLRRTARPFSIVAAGAALVLALGCSGDPGTSAATVQPTDTPPSLMLSGSVAPATQRDSAALVNALARAVALSFQDPALRQNILAALRRSTVREHKLHVQRFFAAAGAQNLRDIEDRNALPRGGLSLALARIPEMEMYLPVRAHRTSWVGDSTVLVMGLLDGDSELKKPGKMLLAFGIDGSEHWLSAAHPPSEPVIVLIPRESEFALNGESHPGATGPMLDDCDPTMFTCGDIGGGSPPDSCTPSTGSKMAICTVYIEDVDDYEGWPRGDPEVSIQLFAVNPDGTGHTQLACLNEDRGGQEYYDQNSDSWGGNATLIDSATVAAAVASGKRVAAVVWEDDTGSKCIFTNPADDVALTYYKAWQLSFAACVIGIGTSVPAGLTACSIMSIVVWLASNYDDEIGVPAGSTSVTGTQWDLQRETSPNHFETAGFIRFRRQSY